jgi:hypothetical protein
MLEHLERIHIVVSCVVTPCDLVSRHQVSDEDGAFIFMNEV